MKHYQSPNTQIVRLSSGEEVLTGTSFSVASGAREQGGAMSPRRASEITKIP